MIYDSPRSKSFSDHCSKSLGFNIFQTSFPQKTLSPFEARFHMEPLWDVGMNICSTILGHMTKMASRLKCYKSFQKSASKEPRSRWLEAWYTATGTQVLQNLFKWWHWVDLDHFFMTWLNLFPNAFVFLYGWKLIQHIVMFFQACSNSAYTMNTGERYGTNGPLV